MLRLSLGFALMLTAEDPRIELVRLSLMDSPAVVLQRTEDFLEKHPDQAAQLGLSYLRGNLLARQGLSQDAGVAFGEAFSTNNLLRAHSLYQIALEEEEQNHPEVAAGLIVKLLGLDPPRALVPKAMALLRRTLSKGGDCRLLEGLPSLRLSTPERRQLRLAQAHCSFRRGLREDARSRMIDLLKEAKGDDTAREAAEWVVNLQPISESPDLTFLVGETLHHHREFNRSIRYLQSALDRSAAGRMSPTPSSRQLYDAGYSLQRGNFWLGRWQQAAEGFAQLAAKASLPRDRAKALYQAGRCLELLGQWQQAADSFRRSFNADPMSRWSDAALLSAMRLEWRTGNEKTALELFGLLQSKRQWKETAVRASLFLASSDLVQGRHDRAQSWLVLAEGAGKGTVVEARYWRGRQRELQENLSGALESYLQALEADTYHPLSRAALKRLQSGPLASLSRKEGLRRARSSKIQDLREAWLLLGAGEAGTAALEALRGQLLADRTAEPYLSMKPAPVQEWPLWRASLREPEELLLALGIWRDGAAMVPRHFPVSQPALALTGSLLLARDGETNQSLRQVEILSQRIPKRIPLEVLPEAYQSLLYPNAFGDLIVHQGFRFNVEAALIRAIIREESRFLPTALSAAAARGLTQFIMPTARPLGQKLGMGTLQPADLYQPPVAITLGAAYLHDLHMEFDGATHMAVAAYNAGEPQAHLWKQYCFSGEPEEYFSKVGFRQTRDYLRKVLTSRTHFQRVYPTTTLPTPKRW
ncbi:MAG: transglycosylase SLT domain-containing protein [Deltaproteobacteria bacterium]|nr:transglycosylase SLT domain-containing protein [Deltaproteobacteria bacterium]